jgi:hypothetical protein
MNAEAGEIRGKAGKLAKSTGTVKTDLWNDAGNSARGWIKPSVSVQAKESQHEE